MVKSWETQLDRLAEALQAALGDSLVALLVYGSAAREGASGPRADVNVLLIVRDASSAGLRPVAEAIAGWVKAGYAPPLVFGEAEWHACTDVFPIEIEDMREAHRLLAGRDPFAGLATTHADLRRELEREVRSKLLHLRTAYAAAAPDGKALEALLEQSSGTMLTLLRAALRVAGRPVPADAAGQVAAAAELAGFDPAGFQWVVARRAGATTRRLEPYDGTAAAYVDAVQRLAAWVDTYSKGDR
jgi:hypothetical protein